MSFFKEFMQNRVLFAAVAAWFCAQFSKLMITSVARRKFDIERLWGAGGMPSAHSSMVCSLTISMARFDGINTPAFALAVMFSFVTIYDAMGVRREAGLHAKILNKYISGLENERKNDETESSNQGEAAPELKEFIGHTPIEVLGGALLGILVGMVVPG